MMMMMITCVQTDDKTSHKTSLVIFCGLLSVNKSPKRPKLTMILKYFLYVCPKSDLSDSSVPLKLLKHSVNHTTALGDTLILTQSHTHNPAAGNTQSTKYLLILCR